MSNPWKVFAIVLLTIVILETFFIVSVITLGLSVLQEEEEDLIREDICAVNICKGYELYYYYLETQLCECYENGEWAYREVVP